MSTSEMAILKGVVHSYTATTIPQILEDLLQSEEDMLQRPAVIFQDKTMTYMEFKHLTDLLADRLLPKISQLSDLKTVGLFVPECELRLVALYGIIQSGAAYVPIDVDMSVSRIRVILDLTKTRCVLYSSDAYLDLLRAADSGVECISVNELLRPGIPSASSAWSVISQTLGPDPLVGIYHTSGSTGTPKSVPMHSCSTINRLSWQWEYFPLHPGDVGCHKTSIAFMDSMWEIFICLLKGIPVVIFPRSTVKDPKLLLQALVKNNITQIVTVPSLLRNILSVVEQDSSLLDKEIALRYVVSASEALPAQVAYDFLKKFSNIKLLNFYGSTETCGDATYAIIDQSELSPQQIEPLSIGIPMSNMNVYILDEDMQLVRCGELGDIYVSGINVTASYLNPENNVGSFYQNPFTDKETNQTMYKMGDIGQIIDGQLFFHGRRDTQVKVRGHRVELREIEVVLDWMEDIEVSVVLACENARMETQLVAFYVLKHGKTTSRHHLFDICSSQLPKYMIPIFREMSHLPLQPQTGKIDRMALKSIYLHDCEQIQITDFDQTESKVMKVIASEIGIPLTSLSKEDNFFMLGGNSISALSTVLSLGKIGLHVQLEKFLSSHDIAEVISRICCSPLPGEELQLEYPQQYSVSLLNTCPNKEDSISLMAREFIANNPLDIMAGTELGTFEKFVQGLWPSLCEQNLSLVVVDDTSGQVVAATYILRVDDNATQTNDTSAQNADDRETTMSKSFMQKAVAQINADVEQPVKEQLASAGGRWCESFLSAVDGSLGPDLSIRLLHMMEEHTIKLAREKGYDGILAVNSHPVTTDLAEHFLGYSTKNIIHVKDWEMEGVKPFSLANENYYIKCMLLPLTKAT